MALLGKITDHATRAKARLLHQYRGKAKLAALLDNVAAQVQAVEDAYWDLWALRQLETATGAQLDVLGRIVAQEREASSDTTYRLRIRAKIRANRSSGTPADVLEVLALLVTTGTTITYQNQPPGGFVVKLGVNPVPEAEVPLLLSFLQRTKAGGVRAILEFLTPGNIPANGVPFETDRGTFLSRGHGIGESTLDVYSTARLVHGGSAFLNDGITSLVLNNIQILNSTQVGISAALANNFAQNAIVSDATGYAGGWGGAGDVVGGMLVRAALSS